MTIVLSQLLSTPAYSINFPKIRNIHRSLIAGLLATLACSAFAWDTPVAVDVNTTTAIRFNTTLSAAAGAADSRGVVWASDGHTTDNLNGVFLSRSSNGGATWS